MTGWATASGNSGMWKVEDGALTCAGARDYLYTLRNDFSDFHLRAEVKINAEGNSGLYFRARKPLVEIGDYEAQITNAADQQYKTGSLYGIGPPNNSIVAPDTWFTLEIIAVGKRIRILVNGTETTAYTEARPGRKPQGHIALQQHDYKTRVFFRKIEIKELSRATDSSPFVVLTDKGIEVRKFDTLAEAVKNASDGDTIEIGANGPFVTPPISIENKALTLRAAPDYHPVIRLNREGTTAGAPVLTTNASLILEGLEFGQTLEADYKGMTFRIIANGPALSAANCRFHWPHGSVNATSRICRFRNCQLVPGTASGVVWHYPADGDLAIENCVQTDGGLIALGYRPMQKKGPNIRVVRSTIRAQRMLKMFVEPEKVRVNKNPETLIHLAISESVIDVNHALHLQSTPDLRTQLDLFGDSVDSVLPRLLIWKDRQNLYAENNFSGFVALYAFDLLRKPSLRTLAEWEKASGQSKTESFTGRVHYKNSKPPEDFRLHDGSAGHHARKDGKDLGAYVAFVGPGAAYELWKNTPDYQEWIKETRQQK